MAATPPPRKRVKNDVPAVLRISLDKAKEILAKRKYHIETYGLPEAEEALYCHVDDGMLQNGYPSASWSHTEANIQVSHLVLLVQKGPEHVPYRSRRETASHLCHNKRCIRASHIVKESIGLNGRRNDCLAFIQSPCCGLLLNACGHVPRCLLPLDKSSLGQMSFH